MRETIAYKGEIQSLLNSPSRLHGLSEQRRQKQLQEVASVTREADAIEHFYFSQNLLLPKVINIFTAGFDKPEKAVQIGTYGDDVFTGFPPPDIEGHAGTVSVVDGEITILNGRAHPNEWAGCEDAPLIVSHPLQVWKEIARRQRTYHGIDPLFVLTYLVGVREGHILRPGDVGLIIDDTELTNVVHPGHGPRSIADAFFGSHFQPKAGRSSNLEIAKMYADFAKKNKYNNLYPAAVCGTPGTTEYQGYLEVGLLDGAFNEAQNRALGKMAQETFGEEAANSLSLLFGMGVTAELATMRQTFPDEPDFRVLALGLATDSVGGDQSLTIDHGAVVNAAFAAGKNHSDKLLQFEHGFNAQVSKPFQDFSIKSKIRD